MAPNSQVDIRPLVLYDTHQWKTIKKSYKSYEKLCEALGKKAILYDDYEYWFNQYLEESYYSVRDGRNLQVTDIRMCVLSDVISGKSAEKSIDELCEAFGVDNIDEDNHYYWYNRFESGSRPLSLLKFSNLPLDVIAKIVEKCDLKSYLNLRKMSQNLRNTVDQQRPPYKSIRIEIDYNWSSFRLNQKILTYADGKYTHLVGWRRSEEHQDFAKFVFGELEMALRNPKLRLDFFLFFETIVLRQIFTTRRHYSNNFSTH